MSFWPGDPAPWARVADGLSPRDALLAWFDRERRDLPWRRTSDPWSIWISEVMLQQTQVSTVVPFFERFLARFPTPAALATASEEEVLALWSGLGYYRRARQLQAAARALVAAGGVPRRAAALELFPGVGPYTAAAIASIAFGEAVPVLDGNVARVLARQLALADDPARSAARAALFAAARELLDEQRPGDSNQALMELGAIVCTPRAPRCDLCPLVAGCRAHAAGESERYPVRRPRARSEKHAWSAACVTKAGRWLFVRRGEDAAILPGLWELPTIESERPDPADFAARFGGEWRFGGELGRVRHAVTFRSIVLKVWAAEWTPDGVVAELPTARWLAPANAGTLALTGATRKLIAKLEAES